MALIRCPECHSEISDKAVACPHCGFPLHGEASNRASDAKTFNLTVSMAKQSFLASATVSVILNGEEIAWVGDGQTASAEAPKGENTVILKAAMRKKIITFAATKDVTINAKWNRFSGKLEALCTGEDFKAINS